MVEGDLEGMPEFPNEAESKAFERGFSLAAGLLGSPSYAICKKVHAGPWTIEDEEESSQQECLIDALKQAKKRGHDV